MENTKTNGALRLLITRYRDDESGATAIEYGLISSLISILLVTGGTKIGGAVDDQFNTVADAMSPRADIPTRSSVR